MKTSDSNYTLTNDEIETIQAFAYLVSREAFWNRLMYGAENASFTVKEVEALGQAWKKVYHCERKDRINVAPHLELLVLATYRACINVPADMIPSEQTIEKCLQGYWQMCRNNLHIVNTPT